MTAALEGGEWSAARTGRTLIPRKTRYPFYRRLGGPQGRSGRAEISSPQGFDPVQSSPSLCRYTDWATWATNSFMYLCNKTDHINTLVFLKIVARSETVTLYNSPC